MTKKKPPVNPVPLKASTQIIFPKMTCLNCGNQTKILVRIEDMGTFICPDCDAEFRIADVKARIAKLDELLLACEKFATLAAGKTPNA